MSHALCAAVGLPPVLTVKDIGSLTPSLQPPPPLSLPRDAFRPPSGQLPPHNSHPQEVAGMPSVRGAHRLHRPADHHPTVPPADGGKQHQPPPRGEWGKAPLFAPASAFTPSLHGLLDAAPSCATSSMYVYGTPCTVPPRHFARTRSPLLVALDSVRSALACFKAKIRPWSLFTPPVLKIYAYVHASKHPACKLP